jgi:hypothetical protein
MSGRTNEQIFTMKREVVGRLHWVMTLFKVLTKKYRQSWPFFSWFSSALPEKFRGNPTTRTRPLSSKSLQIHYTSIVTIQSSYRNSAGEYPTEKNIYMNILKLDPGLSSGLRGKVFYSGGSTIRTRMETYLFLRDSFPSCTYCGNWSSFQVYCA